MEVYELFARQQDLNKELYKEITAFEKNAIELARAEYEYKKALSIRTARLDAEGVKATLINLIIYGDSEVAEFRLRRDMADALKQATWEKINAIKKELTLNQDQLKLEYYQTKNET